MAALPARQCRRIAVLVTCEEEFLTRPKMFVEEAGDLLHGIACTTWNHTKVGRSIYERQGAQDQEEEPIGRDRRHAYDTRCSESTLYVLQQTEGLSEKGACMHLDREGTTHPLAKHLHSMNLLSKAVRLRARSGAEQRWMLLNRRRSALLRPGCD